jgi:hypothetical protein
MAAGDFLDVYNDAEYVASLDVVVTCFFMDCAHNILDFMQTIHRVSERTLFYIRWGLSSVLRIQDVYPGPLIGIFLSRVQCQKDSRSSGKYYPGCSCRIRIIIFHPSWVPDPGVRKAPNSGSATLLEFK